MTPKGSEREHYWRVQRMAHAAGADPAAAWAAGRLDAPRWQALIERCRDCPWRAGCARWLARIERTDPDTPAAPPRACLNAEAITALTRPTSEKDRPE
ncbi:hypothetical protein DRV84_14365 [Rhodosalinus sediminis]|jgi:hypothetical protein|uniref:DUF6455 domain-containing protein n=1 Tax=Rhodosalinus sediminis TaxID=1940533 RepID=A0A3D9BKK1_9RHOB|nr:DUF6455 family protein [Rhodosalinus sediminis]REC54038.1 hypothetical protein DRV84_14365 [Rhodosalinus sediminis]